MRTVSLVACLVLLAAAGGAAAQTTSTTSPDGTYPNPEGTYPDPDHRAPELKLRVLVDGFLTFQAHGNVAWLESGAPVRGSEPTFYLNGYGHIVNWTSTTGACPCRSQDFTLPSPVPPDGVGMIYDHVGRGPVKILEQPRDGHGVFRFAIDDVPFEGADWYGVAVGPDPAFSNPDCVPYGAAESYTDPAKPTCAPACPAPPPEARNWTQDEKRAWAEKHCSPAPNCPAPPPEARNWTEEQRRAWAQSYCAPPSEPCAPADGGATEPAYDGRTTTATYPSQSCAPPECRWPQEAIGWTDAQRKEWAAKYCAPPPPMNSACTLPTEAATWTEEQKRAYFASGCPGSTMASANNAAGAQDAAAKAAEALKNNETLAEKAREAAENATGQKIVVPGFGPLAAIAGLGAIGFLAGRRRQ